MRSYEPTSHGRRRPSAEPAEREIREARDVVEECSRDSFPASDPPAFIWRDRGARKAN